MKRTLIVLGLATLVLFGWERALSRQLSQKHTPEGVGRLLPPEVREALRVAALEIEEGGESFLYENRGGWRCTSYARAPVDTQRLAELVRALSDAQGTCVSSETEQARDFGIATRDTLRVSLLGPDYARDRMGLDLQAAFDVGREVPERQTTYVRLRGSRDVWEIDGSLRSLGSRSSSLLPPLVETRLVPPGWPGWEQGLAQVRIRTETSELRLRREMRAPEEAGGRPWTFWNRTEASRASTKLWRKPTSPSCARSRCSSTSTTRKPPLRGPRPRA